MSENTIFAVAKRQRWLDDVAKPLQEAVRKAVASQGEQGREAKDALHGVWLRHPLHAALTDVPIGAWTVTMALDVLAATGRRRLQWGADAAVALGLLASIPTALAGLADWSDTSGVSRRVGMAHALSNVAAVVLFGASLSRRLGRDRRGARALATFGYLAVTLGAYLGGELVYRLGVQVDRNAWRPRVRGFTPVLDETELAEGEPRRALVGDNPIVLIRRGGQVYALGESCAHVGGPLAEGRLEGDTIVCPWHFSAFRLEDGSPVHGPSVHAQPCYEVRVRDGKVEVRSALDT